MEEILILGVVVGRGQVQMENDKVKAVKKQSTPTKIKEVESFWDSQTSTGNLSRTSVIQQNPLMSSREKRNGIGQKNIKRYLKNSRTRLQVNQYFSFQRGKINSEQKWILQNM